MGTQIITGYTGTRHITPAMDASVFRNIIGADTYILKDGDQLAGSMPDINTFIVASGSVSMQGYQCLVTQESLTVDTCPTGYSRKDLVALRYNHDVQTQIDSFTLAIIKGTEVEDPTVPSDPAYNSGIIEDGATAVDLLLYRINLSGSTVTFEALATDSIREASLGDIPLAETSNPLMDGAASPGENFTFARGDHKHPSDTSRVPTTRKVNGHPLSSDVSVTAADVGITTKTATIQTSNWSGTTATVTVSGVTSSNDVIVSPAPSGVAAWTDAQIYCSAQGTNTLTFKAKGTPTVAIPIVVIVIAR